MADRVRHRLANDSQQLFLTFLGEPRCCVRLDEDLSPQPIRNLFDGLNESYVERLMVSLGQ